MMDEPVARARETVSRIAEVQTAAPKLFLPGFVGHTLCHKV